MAEPRCESTHEGYSCVLPAGHEGLHVARGDDVAAWGDGQRLEYSVWNADKSGLEALLEAAEEEQA